MSDKDAVQNPGTVNPDPEKGRPLGDEEEPFAENDERAS
jgi:hypothetical protein